VIQKPEPQFAHTEIVGQSAKISAEKHLRESDFQLIESKSELISILLSQAGSSIMDAVQENLVRTMLLRSLQLAIPAGITAFRLVIDGTQTFRTLHFTSNNNDNSTSLSKLSILQDYKDN
jgi:hypothetical protein